MIEWRPAIRALIYCIQFDDDPTQSVDRAMEAVVQEGALGLEPDGYREAIASALASTEPLARLIPHDHSEDTIRRFLELLRDRLGDGRSTPKSPGPSSGLDAFASQAYPISSHATEADARDAAKQYLDELEMEQPSEGSGGQDGIQDRIYVVGPNGRYRVVRPA